MAADVLRPALQPVRTTTPDVVSRNGPAPLESPGVVHGAGPERVDVAPSIAAVPSEKSAAERAATADAAEPSADDGTTPSGLGVDVDVELSLTGPTPEIASTTPAPASSPATTTRTPRSTASATPSSSPTPPSATTRPAPEPAPTPEPVPEQEGSLLGGLLGLLFGR
ncbi:hypothetical protein N803_15875 [Knoellia subterranea KCTC 19937]|uniref:Uncharacterized protein n=1 Tax=Knoellia subterranea KCTC 19937 TaxID=1385521 RepID=A0A0A0JMP2_9MICO|nr:hypothetical protein N803_15875 [Knoellia subterranea KCTC 19937]